MSQKYNSLKIFRFSSKIDSLPRDDDQILAPIHVRLKPTNACNHRCWYCAYRQQDLQLGQDMNQTDVIPRDKMSEIIDDFIDLGVKAVTFSGGGEPFCYPHLAETAGKLAQSPVKFAALTNGSRLENEAADVFARHATWVRVSMDGWDDASYASYRNTAPHEFSRVMSNMERFKKIGGPCHLGVSLILDRRNWPQAFDLTTRLRDVGVDSVKVSPCIVSNDSRENQAFHDDIFDSVRDMVDRIKSDLTSPSFEIHDAYHRMDLEFEKDYSWCPYLQILPVIGADLNVYSCQDKAYNLACGKLGSIRDQRFKDFWFSDKNNFFQIDPSRDCGHHCVGHQKNRLVLDYLNVDREHAAFV